MMEREHSKSSHERFSRFKTRLFLSLERRFGLVLRKKGTFKILDRTYTVIRGAVRIDDYDDAWLLALGHHSKVVFDIGCNIGQASLLMLYSGKIQQIVLVDPNPEALAICAENLILNGLSIRARFVSVFVSENDDEEVEFFTVGSGAAGSIYRTHAVTASALRSSIMVPTLTLDSLAERLNVVPDLVKVDVEGAERLVLNGAKKIARRQSTSFMVEMHSSPEVPIAGNGQAIINWCRDNAYKAWYLKEKIELKVARQLESRGRCHLLLLPEAAVFPEYLQHLEQGAKLEKVQI